MNNLLLCVGNLFRSQLDQLLVQLVQGSYPKIVGSVEDKAGIISFRAKLETYLVIFFLIDVTESLEISEIMIFLVLQYACNKCS